MLTSPRSVWLVTAGVTVLFTVSAWTSGDFDTFGLWEGFLLAANTLSLLAILYNPVLVVLALGVFYPLWLFAGNEGHLAQSLPAMTALYASGGWSAPLWVRAIALATPVWMVMAAVVGIWDAELLEIGYVGILFVVAWALGALFDARRAHVQELETKTAQLEAAREDLARRAVADERARIARELHDVVAHAMSLITVQAGVGAHLVQSDSAKAGESLSVIERTGRQALNEMRRLLAVLTPPGDGSESPAPQPGISDLDELVEQAREAGVSVDFEVQGETRTLPAGLELTIYRVVQEALTNVVKHAPEAPTTVSVQNDSDRLTVKVHSQRPVERLVFGQGLRGMQERVALYDGELSVTGDDDGLEVTASFPLEDS